MTGRLASVTLTAGVPQKIYTVPAGKALSGSVLVINASGASASIQAKNCVGLAEPTAAFPFSNAVVVSGGGANGFLASPYRLAGNAVSLGVSFSGAYIFYSGTSLGFIDTSIQLAPTITAGLVPSVNNTWSRDERDFNAASANRFWANISSELIRYIDTTSSPFAVGTNTSRITGCAHGRGVGASVIAVLDGGASGSYGYGTSVSATPGTSVAQSTLPQYTATFGSISASDYCNRTYSRFFVANGVWFFAHVDASNQLLIWSTATPQTVGSWTSHGTAFSIAARDISRVLGLYHHSGFFWLASYYSSSMNVHRTPDSLSGTPAWTSTYASGASSNSATLGGFLRASGRLFFQSNSGYANVDLPGGGTSSPAWSSGITFGPNYAAVSGKLAPVDITAQALHAVVTAGATDATNDLTIYTEDRVYRLATDATWDLQHVTTAADWMYPTTSVANGGQIEFGKRLWSAGDEIWVRSNQPNVAVRIDGFLFTS